MISLILRDEIISLILRDEMILLIMRDEIIESVKQCKEAEINKTPIIINTEFY
jgi:hypothetical protein